jgi:hypothetical protein
MKNKVTHFAASLLVAWLVAACNTSPPAPPVCDGKAKKPINGRTLTDNISAKGASNGCRHS